MTPYTGKFHCMPTHTGYDTTREWVCDHKVQLPREVNMTMITVNIIILYYKYVCMYD